MLPATEGPITLETIISTAGPTIGPPMQSSTAAPPVQETTFIPDSSSSSSSSSEEDTVPPEIETTAGVYETTLDIVSTVPIEDSTAESEPLPVTEGPVVEDSTPMVEETTFGMIESTLTPVEETTIAPEESTMPPIVTESGGESTEMEPSQAPSTTTEPSSDSSMAPISTEGEYPEVSRSTIMEAVSGHGGETTEMMESTTLRETSEGSTGMMESTTGGIVVTSCDDCPELNVELYNDDPYEDGASVLNRYMTSGCKFVQFFCRPFEQGDERPVRTVFNGNPSIRNISLSTEMSCRNGEWYDGERNISVTSLSCIYEVEETTTPMPTTFSPGDPDNPCMQCDRNLYVSPSVGMEGSAYIDYRVEQCLSIHIYCQPTKTGQQVCLHEDGEEMDLRGPSLNRTFSCGADSRWLDDTTSSVIGNVSCVMKKGAAPSTPWMSTTMEGSSPLSSTTIEGTSSAEPSTARSSEEMESTMASDMSSTLSGESTMVITTENGSSGPTGATAGSSTTSEQPSESTAVMESSTPSGGSSTMESTPRESTSSEKSSTDSGAATSMGPETSSAPETSAGSTSRPEISTAFPPVLPEISSTVTRSTNGSTEPPATIFTGMPEASASTNDYPEITTEPGIPSSSEAAAVETTMKKTTVQESTATTITVEASTSSLGTTAEVATTEEGETTTEESTTGRSTFHATTVEDTTVVSSTTIQMAMEETTMVSTTERSDISTSNPTEEASSSKATEGTTFVPTTPLVSESTTISPSLSTQPIEMSSSSSSLPSEELPTTSEPEIFTTHFVVSETTSTAAAELDTTTAITPFVTSSKTTGQEENTTPSSPLTSTAAITEVSVASTTVPSTTLPSEVETSSQPPIETTMQSTTSQSAITSTLEPISRPTTSSIDLGACYACKNLPAQAMSQNESYNGMMVLDHTTSADGCRSVEVNCVPTTAGENATLYLNAGVAISSGDGSHTVKFSCNADGEWITSGGMVTSSVSCLVRKRELNESTPSPEVSTSPTTTSTTTPRPPGVVPCMACPQLRVSPLTSGYLNGFTTLLTSSNGTCRTIELTCEGNQAEDQLALVISGTVFEEGVGSLKTNLTCNDMMTWTTSDGYAVPFISCGIKMPTTTTTSTTTTSTTTTTTSTTTTTTTVPTTTTTPTLCDKCGNLQPAAAELTGGTYANGQLIVDHFTDLSNCRVVVIRCSADANYENATILFNKNIEVASAPTRISSSLTCSQQGTWMRLDEEIKTTSCRVSRKTDDTTEPPVLTTTVVTTTTTQAGSVPCSNCNRMLVTSVPSGYTNGFLMMNTFYTGDCINVELSCSAPDQTSDVALISSTGTHIVGMPSRANLTLTCDNQARWITPANTAVDNLSCAVAERVTKPPVQSTTAAPPPTVSGETSCASSTWAEWREWSNCTDSCGACGTRQRFRACNKAMPDCFCDGTAFEKEVCNQEVCRYPRNTACCTDYTPSSYNGRFICMKAASRV